MHSHFLFGASARTTRLVSALLVAFVLVLGGFFINTAHATITNLTLTDPTGGEEWRGVQNITWTATDNGTPNNISILLSTNGGGSYSTLVNSISSAVGTYPWNTTTSGAGALGDGSTYRIRLFDPGTGLNDESAANFTDDNTPPSTAIGIVRGGSDTGTGDWYSVHPTITLTCTDATSGCRKVWYAWDSGTPADYAPNGSGEVVVAYPAPAPGFEGEHTLHYYSDDQAIDALGAHNVEGEHIKAVKIDTIAPTLGITLSDDALKIGDTSTVTFTFSEAVSGFENTDITVLPNGTLTPVATSDGGTTWTATFTPNAGVEDTSNVITVDKSGVTDVAGNAGSGTTDSPNYAIDTVRPTVGIGLSDTALKIGDTAIVTFTFSETPAGFTSADVTTPNGSIGVIDATNPLIQTAVFTPTAGIEDAENVITVGTDWADVPGNAPAASTDSGNYAIDTIAPTAAVTYSDADALVKQGDSLTITATFSQPLLDAPVVQITISGSNTQSAIDMTKVDTTHYTYVHTVGAGDGLASVALSVGTDAAGNEVIATPTAGASFMVDNTAPTVVITMDDTALNIGDTSTVTFTWDAAVTGFDNDDITVIENGTLSPVSTSDGIVFTSTFTPTASVEDSANVITVTKTGVLDIAGNAGVGTTDSPNYAVDTIAPTVSSVTTKDANTDGSVETATIVFSEAMKDSTFGTGTDFSIGGSAGTGFSTGTADDGTVDITNGGVAGTAAKTVAYVAGSVTDLAGNPLSGFSQTSTDAAKPVLLSARTIDTTHVTATFSEDLDGTTVNGTGSEFSVAGATVSAASETSAGIVTLTHSALGTGAEPLVTYTQVNTLNDLNGNTAVTPVSVTAIDGIAPTLSSVHIVSSNTTPTLAKSGDTVTLTFTSSETITTPTVLIQGVAATVDAPVGNNWTAHRVMTGADTQGTVSISIVFADDAAPTPNSGVTVVATTNASAVFYDSVNPSVNADTDKKVNALVAQNATVSDSAPSSGIATYAWTKQSGPGTVTFGSASSEDTTLSANIDGTYIVRLTVTDNAGNSAYDELTFIWDTTPPEPLTSNPSDGSTGVAIAAGTATVTFDEPIVLLDSSRVLLVDDVTGTSYKGAVAVSGLNPSTLTIGYSGLAYGTKYRINVKAGNPSTGVGAAVRDVAGNWVDTSWTSYFTTTIDTVVPIVNSASAGSITTTGATLSVTTDESATCRFATTDSAYGSMTAFDAPNTGTSHTAILTGLSSSTGYDYFIRCADTTAQTNTMTASAHVSFTTLTPDTTAPAISNIQVSPIAQTTATVTWNTNENATSRVEYGLTSAYGSLSAVDSTPDNTSHSVSLTSLTAGTTYHFRVLSTDAALNVATSGDNTFTTAAPDPDTIAPPIPSITTGAATVNADAYTIAGTAGADTPSATIRTISVYNGATLAGTAVVPVGQTGWAVSVTLAQSTANSFTAISTDASGNASVASSAVVITEDGTVGADVTPPSAPAITTGDATVDADTYEINGTLVDDGGTRSVSVYESGSVIGTAVLPVGQTAWAVTVTLLQSTLNTITAKAADEVGNLSIASNTLLIKEATAADTSAPIGTNIQASGITASAATITWDTNENATSLVEYGLTSGYGSMTTIDLTADNTSHSVALSGLSAGTGYHYRVVSADTLGNSASSTDNTFTTAIDDTSAVLAVTGIDAVKTFATDTNVFTDGWRWTFHVTVPTGETNFAMKFGDFLSGASTILAASNIRYYTAQSSAHSSSATSVTITGADAYPSGITLDSDLDTSTAGRQIDVTVEAKVPTGSAGGSYSTSYGVSSGV